MAVEDKYSADALETTKLKTSVLSTGQKEHVVVSVVAIAAADDNGSVYRIVRDLPVNAIITEIKIENSAMTAATDYDIGVYQNNSGAVIDKDCFLDGADIHLASTGLNGLTTVALADRYKSVLQLLGKTNANAYPALDIAITANTVGSDAGTVVATVRYVIG